MNKICVWLLMALIVSSFGLAELAFTEPQHKDTFAFDRSPVFSWSGCSADSYLLQIAKDGLFDQMVFQQAVNTNSYELNFDLEKGSYFSRVQSIDQEGEFSCTSPSIEFSIKEKVPLSFSFDTSKYESLQVVEVTVHGPIDAKIFIDITSDEGFNLPLEFQDLSEPSFELVLDPAKYVFTAQSTYADGVLSADQTLSVGEVKTTKSTQKTSTQEKEEELFTVSLVVQEFEGEFIDEGNITIILNQTNESYLTNESGEVSILLSKGEYDFFFEKNGWTPKKRSKDIDEDETILFTVIQEEDAQEEVQEKTEEKESISTTVLLQNFDQEAYSSSYVPIIFELDGTSQRCQVLTKGSEQAGYEIKETVLKPSTLNEVILTSLSEDEYDIRVRCILSSEEAIISQTKSLIVINIEDEIAKAKEQQAQFQKVLDVINALPTSFKQVFIDDIVSLENYISESKSLIKKVSSSDDLLVAKKDLESLTNSASQDLLSDLQTDSKDSVISYSSLDDVEIVKSHLDLSMPESLLLEQQEQFAIKTNYQFLTLTYVSGVIKKQTLVSNHVIPIEGVETDIDVEEYFVMPSFLVGRLSPTNDVTTKKYDDGSLVRLLDSSSALIFDGWIDDTSLIRTVVVGDDISANGNSITGFAFFENTGGPTWKIPLISFIIIIILTGLFFNPYYSVLDAFEKKHADAFVSKVNACLDASQSQNHYTVIELVPQILDVHDKLSSQEKEQVNEFLPKVQELFYDASYHLAFKKISSKPANRWTYEELAVAIKDFYGSYSKLPPAKQQLYLSNFNQMLHYSQDLLSKVQK